MSLWKRLEKRGRSEFHLDESWHLYAVDLNEKKDIAELKFAQKEGTKYLSNSDYVGYLKYTDLQD